VVDRSNLQYGRIDFLNSIIRATEQEALKSGTNSNKFTSVVQSSLSAAAETMVKRRIVVASWKNRKKLEKMLQEIYDSGLSSFLGWTITAV